jgi:hypothetical protein
MAETGASVKAFARQADADLKAWELLVGTRVAECQRLQFLQMACEKLCKAFLLSGGSSPELLRTSHAYIAKPLPLVIRQQIGRLRQSTASKRRVLRAVHHLAEEIEVLSPSVDRNGRRRDNCEYPWEDHGTVIHSPLDWAFYASRLLTAPAGRTFLKLLRMAIDRLL